MTKYPFQYAVLRYMHNTIRREFLNVGVMVYSKEAGFLEAQITLESKRLLAIFPDIDLKFYKQVNIYIANQVIDANMNMKISSSTFNDIATVIAHVCPPNDESWNFAKPKNGLAHDLYATMLRLYETLVAPCGSEL